MAKVLERRGSQSVPFTQMYPHVIGGICEFCGVIDNKLPSTEQYKLCPHFQGLGELHCTYCPDTVDPTEVVAHADMKIHVSPDNPDVLVVVCDSYTCSQKHIERFKRNA